MATSKMRRVARAEMAKAREPGTSFLTREQWLRGAVLAMAPLLEAQGAKLPEDWQVSFGFPKGGGNKAIGQAFPAQLEQHHMFISPILDQPTRILDVLLHEMVHVAVGCEHRHGGEFKRVARAVGLEGKLTATTVSSDSALGKRLAVIADSLGTLHHKQLIPVQKRAAGGGWVRLRSKEHPQYKCVISPKMIENYGFPIDPWGEEMEECK